MENMELTHYGILGQKWGIRRFQNKDGTRTTAGKQRERLAKSDESMHDDYAKTHSNKSIKNMSDEELRNRVNRLQLEKQYSSLNVKEDTDKGKDFVKKIIAAGATIATITKTAYSIYSNYDNIESLMKKRAKEKES